MCICVITYYYEVVVGPGTQFCTLLEVWVLGVGMSSLARKRMYTEDRGLQVPMTQEHGPVTSSVKDTPGSDPRIRCRIQIGMFRSIRVDHTNCLQVVIKTHSFIEGRYDERLKPRVEESGCLTYTGFHDKTN
jgi:hypothetical protein